MQRYTIKMGTLRNIVIRHSLSIFLESLDHDNGTAMVRANDAESAEILEKISEERLNANKIYHPAIG